MRCLAETCGNWTGMGCICEVMDIDPVDVTKDPDLSSLFDRADEDAKQAVRSELE